VRGTSARMTPRSALHLPRPLRARDAPVVQVCGWRPDLVHRPLRLGLLPAVGLRHDTGGCIGAAWAAQWSASPSEVTRAALPRSAPESVQADDNSAESGTHRGGVTAVVRHGQDLHGVGSVVDHVPDEVGEGAQRCSSGLAVHGAVQLGCLGDAGESPRSRPPWPGACLSYQSTASMMSCSAAGRTRMRWVTGERGVRPRCAPMGDLRRGSPAGQRAGRRRVRVRPR
jgi:hypothetical protein